MRPTNSKSRVAEAVILPSGHRRLSEVRVPVRFVDVFSQTPTVGYVKTLLGRCNRKMFLNLVCALSSMTHNNVGVSMEPRWHADFVHDLNPPQGKKTVLKFLAEGRILLSDLQLGLLARYGAQFCSDGPNVGEFNDVVLRILLSANDLVLRAQEAAASTGPAAFFKVEVQSSALPDERFAHVLARFKKFFDWFDAQDVASRDWLPLRIDFERLLGMRVEEYLAAGFAVLHLTSRSRYHTSRPTTANEQHNYAETKRDERHYVDAGDLC